MHNFSLVKIHLPCYNAPRCQVRGGCFAQTALAKSAATRGCGLSGLSTGFYRALHEKIIMKKIIIIFQIIGEILMVISQILEALQHFQ